jgi:hypothetical protein
MIATLSTPHDNRRGGDKANSARHASGSGHWANNNPPFPNTYDGRGLCAREFRFMTELVIA